VNKLQIAVCIKIVPDTGLPVDLDPVSQRLDLSALIYEINPHDAVALRLALDLRAATGNRVSAHSATDSPSEPLLRRVLLAGVDEAHLIRPASRTSLNRSDALQALSEQFRAIKSGVIICGAESADDMQGAFGAQLAWNLNYTFVSQVISVYEVQGDRIELERLVAPGWAQRIRCAVPLVLSTIPYSPAEATKLQLPLLPERIGEKVQIHLWEASGGKTGSDPWEEPVVGARLRYARVRERATPQPDQSLPAAGRISAIYASRDSREGTTLTGTPEEIADRLSAMMSEFCRSPRSLE
jgi:electron transfer flavoprotein alpha/beta subunit